MFHTQLLDVINSRQAWAFVGSGPSTESGAPSWGSLVEAVVSAEPDAAANLGVEPAFMAARSTQNYPRCFTLLEDQIGRDRLEEHVLSSIEGTPGPGPIHKLLADLPFAGYITTNYDNLIETALQPTPGWISVGNQPEDCRLLSGNPSNVVWHIHGSADMASDRSQLVLTEKDYDDFYLEDTPLIRQLAALLAQHRVVAVGFGFADAEVMRLLRRVGRMTAPERPIFGFLPKRGDFATTVGRRVFLHQHNIDAVVYKVRAEGHGALKDLLEIYAALSLRRSLKYRGVRATSPSYDPETTGLLVYNELVLSRGRGLSSDVRENLLCSRILALLNQTGGITGGSIEKEVHDLAQALGHRIHGALAPDAAAPRVASALARLQEEGLVFEQEGAFRLTTPGEERLAGHAADARRLEEQFQASLHSRAGSICAPELADRADRVAAAAEKFLKQCIEQRALGVAMAMTLKQAAQQDYHMLALLRSLPQVLETLDDEQEAHCLVAVIEALLRAPNDIEMKFIGVALQAQFGLHLLGYDDETLTARFVDIGSTAFLIDSTTLIGLLARSSQGADAAERFLAELRDCGAGIATTPLLTRELREHAQWALDRVSEGGGSFQSLPVFEAATGRAGQRSNAFVQGFAAELASGSGASSFFEYIQGVFGPGPANGRRITEAQARRALTANGVHLISLQSLKPEDQELQRRADEYRAHIQSLREEAETFTRGLQVEAEAEALLIVEGVRDQTLSLPNGDFSNAYFVSNTRIIDEVAGADVAITMRPEAALQWMITLRPCSVDDLASLTSGLLWELQERGTDLVDTETLLTAFGPFLDASSSELEAETARLRKLTGNIYAGEASTLDAPIARLDVPVILESRATQRALELEQELASERARADAAERTANMTEKERAELERLRKKETRRTKYDRREQKKAESRRRRGR